MAIFVTGGAGYIGSHTCVELLNAGYEIVVCDNLTNSKIEVIDRIKQITGRDFCFYRSDILDREAVEDIFARHSIEAVVHFAGLKAVGESVQKPLLYYHNNVAGSLVLFQVMAAAGVKRLVFSSSATVYGEPSQVPIKEDFPLSAANPYGATKLTIENILRDVCRSDPEWSVTLLRYFNPIGSHSSGLLGDDPNGIPNNLLPYLLRVAVGELEILSVYGDDYPTPDGTGVRDYIHVVDLSQGHIRALGMVLGRTGIDVYNLGTGRGYSVLEVIGAFEQTTGVKINWQMAPRRPGDIPQCYADPGKARSELGWEAKLDLQQMCRDAWRFVQGR